MGVATKRTQRPATFFRNGTPKCVSARQFEVWQEAARLAPPTGIAGFCTDCTKKFQRRMIRVRRCENVYVKFRIDEDGFEEGFVKQRQKKAA